MEANNLDQAIGYINAVNDVIKYIYALTRYDPSKDRISSSELMEWMNIQQDIATNATIKEATERLKTTT